MKTWPASKTSAATQRPAWFHYFRHVEELQRWDDKQKSIQLVLYFNWPLTLHHVSSTSDVKYADRGSQKRIEACTELARHVLTPFQNQISWRERICI